MPQSFRQRTEEQLLPGEHILWLRPALKQRRSGLYERFAEISAVFMCAHFLFLTQLWLAPVLTNIILPVLAVLLGWWLLYFIRSCYTERQHRQWVVITNRRLLFYTEEGLKLVQDAAPIHLIKLIPENRNTDGRADLRISGPRSLRSHLPNSVLQQVDAVDDLLNAIREDIPTPLPEPKALSNGHPLLPDGEQLLAEETTERIEGTDAVCWYGLGAMMLYLTAVATAALLHPEEGNTTAAWFMWGLLSALTLAVTFTAFNNRKRRHITEHYALGSQFLYSDAEGTGSRPVTSCYPVTKVIYPDGSGKISFNYPGKSYRRNAPFGFPRTMQHRKVECILHAICHPTYTPEN